MRMDEIISLDLRQSGLIRPLHLNIVLSVTNSICLAQYSTDCKSIILFSLFLPRLGTIDSNVANIVT